MNKEHWMYVEIDGRPCCMELVSKLDDSFIPQGYSREELLDSIHTHKRRGFLDCVTGIYNRRYYTERLCRLEKISAVALAELSGRKVEVDISASYGPGKVQELFEKIER